MLLQCVVLVPHQRINQSDGAQMHQTNVKTCPKFLFLP